MMRVFVYGSLKQGYGNNHVFPKGSKFLYEGTTKGRLISLGGFPGLLKDTEGTAHGEVWDVPDITPLDRLEGNGSFYTREEVAVYTGKGAVAAWTYFLPKEQYEDRATVTNGVW